MGFSTRPQTLAHTISGPDAARPLLFIHGFPVDSRMWSDAASRLSTDFRCILPDLRGFGATPPTAPQSIADHADDLAALLYDIRETRPVVVVGLSMGGIIAFEFFRRYRSLMDALILVCSRANGETPEGVARRETIAQTVLTQGVKPVADSMIGAVLSPAADPRTRDRVYRMMLDQPATGVASGSRALASRSESYSTLARIDTPTLCIVGEHDSITPFDLMRDMHEKIPGSRFASIPGAGHIPPMETPDEFSSIVRSFVGSLHARR